MSIIAPRRPPFPSAWEQSLEDRLIDAQCTIAELRKRIVELEADASGLIKAETVIKAMVEACEDCDADGVIAIARTYFDRAADRSA
jgi:hypothetical protein